MNKNISTTNRKNFRPILYMVATPIGNLEDITLRAVRLLETTPLLIAEDTRIAKKLLIALKISNKPTIIAHHENSIAAATQKVMDAIIKNETAIYVADAGTPSICDPGRWLVATAKVHNIKVVPVPGASALTALLSVCSFTQPLPLHFLGYPPATKNRQQFFAPLQSLGGWVVIFEAPHRITQTIDDLLYVLGDVPVTVGRELTKYHEQIINAPLSDIAQAFANGDMPARGEFVLCLPAGNVAPTVIEAKRLMQALIPVLGIKKSAKITSEMTGVASRQLYQQFLPSED